MTKIKKAGTNDPALIDENCNRFCTPIRYYRCQSPLRQPNATCTASARFGVPEPHTRRREALSANAPCGAQTVQSDLHESMNLEHLPTE